jgi:MFS family permease
MADRDTRRRVAVTVVFFVLGLSAGTWAARIPAVKDALHLSAGVLGLALLGPALGSVLAMPATGAILATVPPRRVVQVGLLFLAAMLPVTTLATSAWQLFIVLAGWGAGLGIVDVGMNIEAAAVQARYGRSLMSGFHAAYSVGGLAGAGLGGIAAAARVSARADFLVTAAVVLVAGGISAQAFAARPAPSAHGEPARGEAAHGEASGRQPKLSRWPQWSWTLVCLAAIAFGSFLSEGAANDWSAVYLHFSLGASVGLAAVGYAVFSATMTGGRLIGDRLADRMGPARLVRLSAGVAAVSFGAALLIGQVWSGLAGFAVLGAGLSVVVPLAFSAASTMGRQGPNLALVTSCGYLGMLVGPAVIGGLAELVGLPGALGTVVVLSGMTAILGHLVLPRTSRRAGLPPPPQEVLSR